MERSITQWELCPPLCAECPQFGPLLVLALPETPESCFWLPRAVTGAFVLCLFCGRFISVSSPLARMWINTYLPCRRATASLPLGYSTTALSSQPSGPMHSRKTTGMPRTSERGSTSLGTDTVPGSHGLGLPRDALLAGTKGSQH